MQNQWENGVCLALPSLLIFWQESHIVGFPIAGRWSSIILLIIETFRFHISKGKIQIRVSLKNLISHQGAGAATSSKNKFHVSGDLWVLLEIMGKFATASYQRCNKDSCFSSMFPVGASSSKVNLTWDLCQYRLNVCTLKVPWHRVQSLGLWPTVLIFLLEQNKIKSLVTLRACTAFQHSGAIY